MQRFVVLVAFLSLFLFNAVSRSAEKPNILFFLSDDHRSDMLSCAGHDFIKTPNIDRLAEQGVRFENMFVTTSICAASRATFFTGMYERSHRFTFGTPPIAADFAEHSYPMLLKNAGYRTGFVGKFGVSMAKGKREAMFDFFKPLNRNPYMKTLKDGTKRHLSDIAGDAAIQFLDTTSKDQPFCLSVSFNAVHAEDSDKQHQYTAPDWTRDMYVDDDIPPAPLSDPKVFESQPEFMRKSMNRDRWYWRWDTEEKYQRNIREYYRMIAGMDGVVGRVVDHLKKLGVADNTVVLFAGDNGYYAASRGFAGKWSHYEESLRVPLVIYDPRLPTDKRGRIDSHMVLNVDFAPTVIEIAGIEQQTQHQGGSLLPFVADKEVADWRTDFFCEHLMNNASIPKWEGVRDQRWVYARYFEQKPEFEFLHDLKTDPQQLLNLASDPKFADELEVMRTRMKALREDLGGEYKPNPIKRKR